VLGMLTHRDLMQALALGGMESPVRDAMKREFVTADSHDMLENALTTMRAAKCRSMPILHDGMLVGLLTMDHVGELVTIQMALRQARRSAKLESSGAVPSARGQI